MSIGNEYSDEDLFDDSPQEEKTSVPKSFTFNSQHSDLIHDVQLDYYGKILASASSDGTIKLFEVNTNSYKEITTLRSHSGPVWRVSWSHPRYGKLLASCGYDRKLIIHKSRDGYNNWNTIFVDDKYETSVNCCTFAPLECGPILVACDSNGNIVIYGCREGKWRRTREISGHNGSINGVSFSHQTTTIISNNKKLNNNNNNNKSNTKPHYIRRFATCGSDNKIKLWIYDIKQKKWRSDGCLSGHNGWVRDVAFSPIPSSESHSVLASCGEDKRVLIHKEQNGNWQKPKELLFNDKVWSVCWSELGNILGVSFGENQCQLFKEGVDQKWHQVSKINNKKN